MSMIRLSLSCTAQVFRVQTIAATARSRRFADTLGLNAIQFQQRGYFAPGFVHIILERIQIRLCDSDIGAVEKFPDRLDIVANGTAQVGCCMSQGADADLDFCTLKTEYSKPPKLTTSGDVSPDWSDTHLTHAPW